MSSKSSNTKTTQNTTTSVNSTFDGQQNYQVVNSSGNEITFTDYGAIDSAFDAFNTANSSINNALGAVTKNTDKTVSALKEFATQLTVGDIESSKWIALSIIAAVLIAVVVFFISR